MNKGHLSERQHMVYTDLWPLFGGYFILFYQGRIIEVWPLFTDLQGGLYLEVTFHAGLTVSEYIFNEIKNIQSH